MDQFNRSACLVYPQASFAAQELLEAEIAEVERELADLDVRIDSCLLYNSRTATHVYTVFYFVSAGSFFFFFFLVVATLCLLATLCFAAMFISTYGTLVRVFVFFIPLFLSRFGVDASVSVGTHEEPKK